MRHAGWMLVPLALAGCSLEPRAIRPLPPVAATWPAGDAYLRTNEAPLPAVTYQDIFRDPKLQALIVRALANNQDLAAATGSIEQARAQYRVVRAAQLPALNATGGATLQKSGNGTTIGTNTGTTTTGSTDTTGTGTGTGTTGTGTTGTSGTGSVIVNSGSGFTDSYRLTAGISSFELDLFGRLSSLSHAALDQYLATEAGARTVRLSLVGELASAYLTYAANRSLAAIAADTLASAQRTTELTDARLQGGVAPRTDLAQATQTLERARADLQNLTTQLAQSRNAIDLLVGAPTPDADLPGPIEAVDGLLAELPAGLSSDVLLRRPDVVQAEYLLYANNARIGAARAAFFPRISLTTLAGLASGSLGGLFSGGAFTWSVSPSVSLPIFDGGVTRGNLAYARASRDVALAQYRRAVQVAFRDVADALAQRGTIDQQLASEQRIEAAAQTTFDLTTASYRAGVTPFLNTLDAQRTLYTARRTVVTTRLTRATNLVTLYRSLGGDQLVANVRPAGAPRQP